MTVTTSYPGVYVQELPSGSRTVTGVATSITAFIGAAARGPVDEPVPIASFADFERAFGGLWRSSGLGYAVRDFYLNGGGEALIVRVVHTDENAPDDSASRAAVDAGGLPLVATGPGSWANGLVVEVTHPTGQDADDIAEAQGVTADDLFSLVVRESRSRRCTQRDVPQRDGGGRPAPGRRGAGGFQHGRRGRGSARRPAG